MVSTRTMARSDGSWNQERDELRQETEGLRTRLELYEARTKVAEELIASLRARVEVRDRDFAGEDEAEISGNREARERVPSKNRWRKLEIPIFSGSDAVGWTQKLERYFALREVTEEEKMQATMVALEGRALSWSQWWERCNPSPSWDAFKLAVVDNVSSIQKKAIGLALSIILTLRLPQVLDKLDQILSVCTSVILGRSDDLTEEESSGDMSSSNSHDEGSIPSKEFRKRQIKFSDSINQLSLEDSVRENLQTCAAIHGESFNAAMSSMHPSAFAQLKQALKMP